MIFDLYDIPVIVVFVLLAMYFESKWIVWLFSSAAIFVFCALVYEHVFQRKTKTIKNKHVVVTGGSSGIGKCIAILAAKRGANVTIIARNVRTLEEARYEILQACENKDTQRIEYRSLDIGADYETVEKTLTELETDMGPIYMLVNCAGLALASKIEDTTIDTLNTMIRTNFLGTYYCIKAVVPRMKFFKEGVIVLVSSQAGLLGVFGYTAYCSTKFALRGLAESLAMELKPYNISVTLSLPQDTDTPGYAIEELSKPPETKAISQVAKLIQPEIIAEKTLVDALAGNFFSTVGLESFLVATVCAGLSPVRLFRQLYIQMLLMSPLRFVGVSCLAYFDRIIAKYQSRKF
ncbi:3-ketodihydrosphingosine reductase [Monomorium pharaonis]|uniref:3-ketodihydrosphingosine reductase n=1 Tax=Monomorium pharaonis TaxID=307658 RepID=UPI00063F55E6|nr:3-ketodihydrosphingosine reductase [Monomorium pharaonis]